MLLRQHAWNGAGTWYTWNRQVTVAFDTPSQTGSLLVLAVTASHLEGDGRYYPQISAPSGWSSGVWRREDELDVGIWYRQNAPATTSVTVTNPSNRGIQARILEVTGAAQTGVLDKISVTDTRSRYPDSGSTGTVSQGDELIVAVVANRYASTTQYGITGGLQQLGDTVSPWGVEEDSDNQRHRMTVHIGLPTTAASWRITGQLTTARDWVAAVLTFKGGSLGPAQMTSVAQPDAVSVTGGGADLTVFGPLTSTDQDDAVSITGGTSWIGPFAQQMRLGGQTGLLIGPGTPYRIEDVAGLGGADVRTSDGALPYADGDSRGVDLQSARIVQIKVNFDDQSPTVLQQLHSDLLTALVPRREDDWDLIFRKIGQPMQSIQCRPIQLALDEDILTRFLRSQTFALRAADPRIYSAREQTVTVPVTPAGVSVVTVASAINVGNARAYPVIQLDNHDTVDVTRVELVNVTGDVAFEVDAILQAGSQLIGDMPARVTQSGRSTITLDGQPRYNAWASPREPFFLVPAPTAVGGVNALYLRTTPAGAAVTCTVTYRDTSAT